MTSAFTPQLQLETLFILDDEGRIVSTRDPHPEPGPAFSLIRDARTWAWAVNVDVPSNLARQLVALAQTELPPTAMTDPPRHGDAYVALLGGRIDSGPAFTFPAQLPEAGEIVAISDIRQLERHLNGWTADEIPERAPIVGVMIDGHAVSVCFCARRSEIAAEAGVNTAPDYRGRGFASRVTSAWARMIRDSGRLPIYSTSWSNSQSLAVARKLGLSMRASDWNLYR